MCCIDEHKWESKAVVKRGLVNAQAPEAADKIESMEKVMIVRCYMMAA